MSRIGKKPIAIPSGVTVTIANGLVTVKGPKGELKRTIHPLVTVTMENNECLVDVAQKEEKMERSLWGTTAAHIRNMVEGVTTGFKKQLEINGVGYRLAMQGKDIKLEVGYSHPVVYDMPADMKATIEKNVLTLESSNIELLGKVAADLRSIRKPEPYKGKGIKYSTETIRRKAGKAAKAAAA